MTTRALSGAHSGLTSSKLFTPEGVSRSLVLEKELQKIAPQIRLAPCSDCLHPSPGVLARQALAMANTTDRWGVTHGLTQRMTRWLADTGPKDGVAPISNARRVALAETLLDYANTKGGRAMLEAVGQRPVVYTTLNPNEPRPGPEVPLTQAVFDSWKKNKMETGNFPLAKAQFRWGLAIPRRPHVVTLHGALLPHTAEEKTALHVLGQKHFVVLDTLQTKGIDIFKKLDPIELGMVLHHENLHLKLQHQHGVRRDEDHGQIGRVTEHLYLRDNDYAPQGTNTREQTAAMRLIGTFTKGDAAHHFLHQAAADLSNVVGSPQFDARLLVHLKQLPRVIWPDVENWLLLELLKAGKPEPSKADLIPN